MGAASQRQARLPPEQLTALAEILRGPAEVDPWDIEAMADRWCERADLPVSFPDPVLRAAALGFDTLAVPHFPGRGAYCDNLIYYRPYRDARRRGWIVTHETSEGVCARERIRPPHPDIQRLALAMTACRQVLDPLLRRHTPRGVVRVLARANPHAPVGFLRLRVERYILLGRQLSPHVFDSHCADL